MIPCHILKEKIQIEEWLGFYNMQMKTYMGEINQSS